MMKKLVILLSVFMLSISGMAQQPAGPKPSGQPAGGFGGFGMGKRTPVLITNDLSGDVDGIFALVHQLLCQSSDIKGIVGTHLGSQRAWTDNGKGGSVTDQAVARAKEVMDLLEIEQTFPIVKGADKGLESTTQPIESEGAKLIVEEAKKHSPEKPLYVTVGASLTDVASAWLMDPSISKNIIVVWIGGQEYPFGHPFPPQYNKGNNLVEYNARLDIKSVQVVFNQSDLTLWQIPRDVYRQALYGMDEITDKIAPCGEIGKYLEEKLHRFGSDTYVLGDSPMVLISTLTTTFEPGAASSFYEVVKAPTIRDDGHYDFSAPGRDIIVYKNIDTRLLFGDMESKIRKAAKAIEAKKVKGKKK